VDVGGGGVAVGGAGVDVAEGPGVLVGTVVQVGVLANVEVAPPVAVTAPVADGVGVAEGSGMLVDVGGVSPERRILVGGNVGVGMNPPPTGVAAALGIVDGVELGPPPAIRVASTAANTVA